MTSLIANLAISAVQGAAVAGITALLGSSVWWLWGICFAALTFVIIGTAQVATLDEY